MKKKLIATATGAVLTLALAACSQGGSKLDDVQYNMNQATAEPSVSFATPFAAKDTSTHVIEQGNGDDIKEGDNLLIEATVFKGDDGSKEGSTYTQAPILIPVGQTLKDSAPELYDVLTTSKVGTSFSYTTNMVAGGDASSNASSSPSPAADGTATNVEVYTVKSKLPTEASGKETPKEDINPALKSFTIGKDGKADLKLVDDRGENPTKLVSQDLITGDGEKVKKTDTVYVKYQGVRWEDGKAFDGNYDSDPASFNLQGVLQGWTEGLAGKTVGSRVLLIVPEAQAYGKDAQNGAPSGPLVFVVDILGAADNPEAAAAATATPSASASSTSSAAASASATASASETKK